MSILVAPGLAVVLFTDVLTAAVFISLVVSATGFLGYCEMYRALREINDEVKRIDAGVFDIDFGVDRTDEIGETYTALEETARSLGATIEEAETARETAEQAREEAEEARREAEAEQDEMAVLTSHLQSKATAYQQTLAAAADGDLTARVDPDSTNDAMTESTASQQSMVDEMTTAVGSFADRASDLESELTSFETTDTASGKRPAPTADD